MSYHRYEGDDLAKATEPVPAPVAEDTAAEFSVPLAPDPQGFVDSALPDVPIDTGPPPEEDVMMNNLPDGDGDPGQESYLEPRLSRRGSMADHDSHGIGIKEDG